MGSERFQVWTCTLVVPADAELPDGFDMQPRRAVIEAMHRHGIDVVALFSGWGGTITEGQAAVIDLDTKPHYSAPRRPSGE